MRRHMQVVLVLMAILLAAAPALAALPTGEVNLAVGYEWDSEEKSLSRNLTQTGFRLALEDNFGVGNRFHASAKGWWDWKHKEGSLGLDQIWLRGYFADVDYQVGRQVISWGTADGFNPTNYFARLDT